MVYDGYSDGELVIVLDVFSNETEELVDQGVVPWALMDRVVRILGLESRDAWRGGYELDPDQRHALERLFTEQGCRPPIDLFRVDCTYQMEICRA